MNTELKNAVKAADLKAQYDARVKRLVGHCACGAGADQRSA